MIKVAINGFGRIGRTLSREILKDKRFKLVLINDIFDTDMMKYLFNFDSVYGKSDLSIDDIQLTSKQKIEDLNLKDIDILFECSGIFTTKKELQKHIDNGAKKVILTAHSKDIPNYIADINDDRYNAEKIISASSCTANCIVPVLKLIDDKLNVKRCNITTVHSYTSEQNLLDNKNSDIRRCRAAPTNIIPLSSNAAKTTSYFLPHLKNKIFSTSIRVPVENSVLVDIHIELSKRCDIEDLKELLSSGSNKNGIKLSSENIVSRDVKASPFSSIIDEDFIQMIKGDMLRVFLWQDNEYGYIKRVLKLAQKVGNLA